MAKDKYYGKTLRKNFARHEEVMAMPDLLEIQKKKKSLCRIFYYLYQSN